MALYDDINGQIDGVQASINAIVEDSGNLIDSIQSEIDRIDRNYKLDYSTVGNIPELGTIDIPEGKPGDWFDDLDALKTYFDVDPSAVPKPILSQLPEIANQLFVEPEKAPVVDFGRAPTAFNEAVPTVPQLAPVAMPTKPDMVMPVAPSFSAITIPATPEFTKVAAFAGVKPADLDPAVLTPLIFNEESYASGLKDAAEAWLQDIVANGGTGLHPDVEAAIFNRSRSREIAAYRENLENTADEFAASGFPRPTGALRARLASVRAGFQTMTEDLSRKITEDQAKLAQENTHFALIESLKHEAVLLQHHNNVYDRLLTYGIAVTENSRAIFGLRVSEYQAKWDGFKAEAQVFGDLIRAAAMEVEQYKAEVDAELSKVEVDKAVVERYRVMVSALEVTARIYSTEMEAAKIEAEVEALKLVGFKSEIDGFEAAVKAKELENDSYKTTIAGSAAKIDAFRASVDATNSINAGKIALIDADKSRLDGAIKTNLAKLDEYRAYLDAVRTKGDVAKGIVSSASTAYMAKNDTYRTNIDMEIKKMLAGLDHTKLAVENSQFMVDQYNARSAKQGQLIVDHLKSRMEMVSAGADSFSNIAAALASQITTISQISASEE